MKLSFPIRSGLTVPKQTEEIPPEIKMKGLGDLVAIVAEPIKQVIIDHGPSKVSEAMKNCNCQQRREALNRLMPFS